MGLVHHLADGLVVVPFKGVAHVQHPLNLTDDIFRPDEVLLADFAPDFVEPYALRVREELYLRVVLMDGGGSPLAGLATLVVCR